MTDITLSDFFKQKVAKSARVPRNWTAKKKQFVKEVEALYDVIVRKYLGDAGAGVTVEYVDTTVDEATIGEYPARAMVVRVGDERIVFTPKGFSVYGASGRVDVRGDRGDGVLVLRSAGGWGIVQGMTPTLRVVPLSGGTLLDLLRDIMRP